MENKIHTLPDDIEELKKIILFQSDKLSEINRKYEILEEELRLVLRKFFAKRSEKLLKEDETQGMLMFNEAENFSEEPKTEKIEEENTPAEQTETITIKEHARKKIGRKKLPDFIPRKIVEHDLSDEEKKCPCCKKERPLIGIESSEELEIIPMQIFIQEHQKKKYGACKCEGFINSNEIEVKSAKAPARMIPGSIVSASLLAYTLTSKFVDAIPFYRLSKMLDRIDVNISRATLCNWMIEAFEKMHPFFKIFDEEMRKGNVMRMDETPLQVICEDGRKAENKSYMWVAIGNLGKGKDLVRYRYFPSRSASVANELLEGYSGYLQTDGYSAYNNAVSNGNIIHVGCFAHARRYFNDAYEASKKKSAKAEFALKSIQKLYEIEKRLRKESLPDNEFIDKRKLDALPVLTKFHSWLVENNDASPPGMALGKAINYALNEWDKLVRYLEHADLTPDNNACERAIRPFVLGRKNWLFSYTPRGAHASAAIYSLVESAKANMLEPFAYLRFLFTKLPLAKNDLDFKNLLPCYLDPKMIIID